MNDNTPIYDLSNMDEALLRSQLWDARMALLDSRYHHQCTIDLWAEINRLFDALDALKAAQRPDRSSIAEHLDHTKHKQSQNNC